MGISQHSAGPALGRGNTGKRVAVPLPLLMSVLSLRCGAASASPPCSAILSVVPCP